MILAFRCFKNHILIVISIFVSIYYRNHLCKHLGRNYAAQVAIVKELTGRNRATQLAIINQMSRQ